jgi:class 3 adenylate cyclase/CHASE2 domain-containing sensor protein
MHLARAAEDGKLVLGQLQGQGRPISPSTAQRVAVDHQRNIRPLNVYTDSDGVIRRVPLTMDIEGRQIPSMAVELAARMLGSAVQTTLEGNIMLDSYRVPARIPNTLTLNFEGGANDIPTYSFIDLYKCMEKGDAGYFRRAFEGRAVLIGVVLNQEDRSLTSKRFATGIEGSRAERCVMQRSSAASEFIRNSIPSVYIHATAVNNLMRHEGLQEFNRAYEWAFNFSTAALSSAIGFGWSPLIAAVLVLSSLIAWMGIGILAFAHTIVLPVIPQVAVAGLALFATIAYRFVVTDKERRLLRRSFAFYLAPPLIEKMMASNKLPHLGGETRVLTLYRSDLVGFTALSERLTPGEHVALMNQYLAAMTEIIEKYGGFVDKYIGDAIDGVFGAPLDDADHALHAVKAALASQSKLSEMNKAGLSTFRGYKPTQRIGLHTGTALVGNIGSPKRFNYTVVGDAANLASRLEGANKFYATSIIASEATAELVGSSIIWRELDTVRVLGRTAPVTIVEPLAEAGLQTDIQVAFASAFAEGLKRWRSHDFGGAYEAFARFADQDPPSSAFLKRAEILMRQPPDAAWCPVNVLDNK